MEQVRCKRLNTTCQILAILSGIVCSQLSSLRMAKYFYQIHITNLKVKIFTVTSPSVSMIAMPLTAPSFTLILIPMLFYHVLCLVFFWILLCSVTPLQIFSKLDLTELFRRPISLFTTWFHSESSPRFSIRSWKLLTYRSEVKNPIKMPLYCRFVLREQCLFCPTMLEDT